MKIKNPVKVKLILLIMAVFVLGGATAITQYAYGSQVVEKNSAIYMISHTEYRFDEQGQIIVRLVNFQGNPVTVDNCTATILYPDKSFFVQDALMSETGNITGDHYYEFTTPTGPEGVYEYQATCNYPPGKSMAATNSFHLSGGFNYIFSNLTAISSSISDFRAEVAANFTEVLSKLNDIDYSTELAEIQASLAEINTSILSIDSDLGAFITETYLRLDEINTSIDGVSTDISSLHADLTAINTTINLRFDEINANLAANFTNIEDLIYAVNSSIIEAINAIDVDLTEVTDAIDALNLSLQARFDSLDSAVASVSSNMADFRQEVAGNFTEVFNWLGYVNTTTVSTYDYMTGTLASNINSLLTTVGIINETVARIENTTQQILQNQEDQVFMTTYSG